MSSRFQLTVLGSSLCYPNAVAWSEENLVAVAAGANVVILNPSNQGVRGLVTLPVGVVDAEEGLEDGFSLSHDLSRDTRPCFRSVSWSPVGLANNAGCLISICTTDGKVKLYRSPFFELSAEWIEVVDISQMLYDYLEYTSFGECDLVTSQNVDVMPTGEKLNPDPIGVLQVCSGLRKRRKKQLRILLDSKDRKNNSEIVLASNCEDKNVGRVRDENNLSSISASHCASRNAMLMSLCLAWSPVIGASDCGVAVCDTGFCSFLSVGGKCGRISLWRVNGPKNYSIETTKYSGQVSLAAIFKSHDAWVTAMDWASAGPDVSNPIFVLATGSSDGSVKIWKINCKEMLNSSGVIHGSVSLLEEVISVDSAMVSVLAVQTLRPLECLLAVGKGSGSFEVWMLNQDTSKSEKIGCFHAHGCIVTGLAWAFERCLYSCSQDNSIKCWSLVGNSLTEVPISSGALAMQGSRDVHYVFESCFGLAISPGNLAMAVARKFDMDLLHPMYEARTHKSAVEFFWIGGQQLHHYSTLYKDNISVQELICWENNILWSLNLFKDSSRLLNIWDAVSALIALKQSVPEYFEDVLLKWLASCIGFEAETSSKLLTEAFSYLPKLSTRQLQLINIISRRVVLRDCKENNVSDVDEPEGLNHAGEQEKLWKELLLRAENELLERLACFNFSGILNFKFDSSTNSVKPGTWSPDGLQLMQQWISQNQNSVKDHSNALAKEVAKINKRKLQQLFVWENEERCTFCSAIVPFESSEYAFCCGRKDDENVLQKHKLQRCATSLRLLPAKPVWYCMCCQRRAMKLPPSAVFLMDRYSSDFISISKSLDSNKACTPCCLFCGILLQKPQPQFSLSPCFV